MSYTAQDLQVMNPGQLARSIGSFAKSCSLSDLETLGEPYRTLLVQRLVGIPGKFDALDRTFTLAPASNKNVELVGPNKNGEADRFLLKAPKPFGTKDALYLYRKYGPHSIYPECKGLIREVVEEQDK